MGDKSDMSEFLPTISSEGEIYRSYERSRRLQLARILLPIFALIQFAVVLVSVVFLFVAHFGSPIEQIFIFNTALVGFSASLHVLGLRFVRRGQINWATASVIFPIGITVVVPLLVYDIFYQPGANITNPIVPITLSEMVATLILIVLSGIMATSRWSLVGTTLAMNIFTVFILNNAFHIPGAGMALSSGATLLVAFPIFVQWAVAGILIASSGTYLKTLRELGDVRVAYARAQQLDQLKDQFIAHVNHELRSPVMALQGHVELLLLTDETLSPEERHSYLERAKHAGDDLVALVTSILAMRRLEQEAETFEPALISVREALVSAIRLVDPRDGRGGSEAYQSERELHVDISSDLEVWADPVRVRQIFTNLLSNAIKYSPSGAPIEVTAEVTPADTAKIESGAWARRRKMQRLPERLMVDVTVRDYGLGIPPEQIPLLFKRFVRLPRDLASNVPGNGLGLYLCQTFAEAMGGSIWVTSTGVAGEGSTFHVRLPMAPLINEQE